MINRIRLVDIINISLKAGSEILKVYHSPDFEIESKHDNSPLTLADRKSNVLITNELQKLYPDIPILSEEGKEQPFAVRKKRVNFWLVDPLDGTKEFIKRNGEFTTNIALVHRGKPVVGAIYAPTLDVMYVAKLGLGCFKLTDCKNLNADNDYDWVEQAEKLRMNTRNTPLTVIASRSHMSEATEKYINELKIKYGDLKMISAGSSLKMCLVAEGVADVYPRFAPTMEWDTAAGHAIVEAAGGTVLVFDTNAPMRYNKENLRNPWFIAKRGFIK